MSGGNTIVISHGDHILLLYRRKRFNLQMCILQHFSSFPCHTFEWPARCYFGWKL